MIKRETEEKSMRYLGTRELCTYLSVGECTARSIGEKSGARVKIGRRVVFDKAAIYRYMETLHE